MLASEVLELENGLKIVTVPQPHLHSCSLALYVRSGSRYENLDEWGLSHFLEHMVFRGSEKFPDSRKLNEIFERSGSMLEAATWRDHTSFTTSLHPTYLPTALEALADMITSPLFTDIDIERRVVSEELHSELDDQGEDTHPHNLSRNFIWPDHPLGRRITGAPHTVENFTVEHLQAHHRKHYVGSNAVLCLAGKLPKNIQHLASTLFCQMPKGQQIQNKQKAVFAPTQLYDFRELRASQLCAQLTFESLPYGHEDFTALELLIRMLDGGMNSRLHQAVCERRGLVYEMSTELDCYTDCGVYDITLKVAPKRAPQAIEIILQTLKELAETGVEQEELEQARKQNLHALEFCVDSPLDVADHYGCSELFGIRDTLEDEAKRLKNVTCKDILRVAKQMFLNHRMHLTLVGPIARTPMSTLEELVQSF